MSIQGVQVIYRLSSTIRLFINYRAGVDSFNIYYSSSALGLYALLRSVDNKASLIPATRGKIVFEFHTSNLLGWVNEATNYIKLAPVVGGVEGALEGPLEIITRVESIVPKEFAVMYGLNIDSQKFIPISVDNTGKIETV